MSDVIRVHFNFVFPLCSPRLYGETVSRREFCRRFTARAFVASYIHSGH